MGNMSNPGKPTESASIDVCQVYVDRVNAAQTVVDSLEARRLLLQTQLQHANPAEKSGIVAQIEDLGEDLARAVAALDEAGRELQSCRFRWNEKRGLVTTGGTILDA